MDISKIIIRELKEDEHAFLRQMFHMAVYVPEGEKPLPENIIDQPELSKYIENWGRKGDYCLVAELENKKAGAVWCRSFDEKSRGYGFVDNHIPELTIAVLEPYRNMGIGGILLQKFFQLLKDSGFQSISLSVDRRNPAVNLYLRSGFRILMSNRNDHIMLREL
ncbi:MAG: GNAT family N-acetyltransferase [Calditrichaceae bacterium]|jgi:ribosomal-protein-alanine N-acetyltransferase